MKKIILSTVVITAMLSMGSAVAGGGSSLFGGSEESSMASGAIYGGASAGQAQFRCTLTDEDCSSTGWKIFGGYKLNQNMAIEGGYYNLGEHDEANDHEFYGEASTKSKASGIGLTGVYTQPVADNFEVFGKLGAMFWTAEGEMIADTNLDGTKNNMPNEESGTSVLFGLGASYQFSDNWGLRGEWERYTAEYADKMDTKTGEAITDEEDIDILSAGLTFSTY